MRLAAAATILLLAPWAQAGEPYAPVALAPAEFVAPPAGLAEAAAELLGAAVARDAEAAAPFIAPVVKSINSALDMHVPRIVEDMGPWPDARSALVEIGENNGGDYFVPKGADPADVLVDHALQNWEWSLYEPIPWGLDPLAEGAICTYALHAFDNAEVGRVAEQLGINSSAFFMVEEETPLLDAPEIGAEVAHMPPDVLWALDYDTDADGDWIAVHLPQGGTGFVAIPEDGLLKPHPWGLCFAQGAAGQWQVVAQVNTTL